MNEQLYASLGIEKNEDLKTLLSKLEEKQFEFLERSETVSDEKRQAEIADILKQLDDEIKNVKAQIKSVSSSVILDQGGEGDSEKAAEAAKAEAEKKAKAEAEKKAKAAAQVEALKQKEAEKQAKEAEKKQKEAEKAAQKAQANNASGQGTASSNAATQATAPAAPTGPAPVPVRPVISKDTAVTDALNNYQGRAYAAAFKSFKDLSEQGNPSAQYMLFVMYRYSLGTPKDEARARFWLKKSAENGEPAGQMEYAIFLLSGTDTKEYSSAFQYLQKLADQGDQEAMSHYVSYCIASKGRKKDVSRAISYAKKLKAASNDSFDKQKIDNNIKYLKKIKKNGDSAVAAPNLGSSKPKRKFRIIWKLVILLFIVFGIIKFVNSNDRKNVSSNVASTSSVSTATNQTTDITETTEVYKTVRVSVTDGNVRSGAGKNNKVVAGVHKNEEYYATGNTEIASNGKTWYEIYLNEEKTETGWVSETIIEIVD